MDKQYFHLDSGETSKFINWVRLLFGALCLSVAIAWVFIYPSSIKSGLSFWGSLLFLTGFGLYQINAGLGRGRRFIMLENKNITVKKNSLLPSHIIKSEELEKIIIMPLSVNFILRNKKNIILRLGTTFPEAIRPIQDALVEFADQEMIPAEVRKDEI